MLTVIQAIEAAQAAIDKVPEEKQLELARSLTALSKKLLADIGQLNTIPQHYQTSIWPEIEAQLKAAEKRTEKAADDILSAAEAIGAVAGKTDGALKEALQQQVNEIFQASSFQDLVAQHLNEIKLRLAGLNEDMAALQAVLGGNEEASAAAKKKAADEKQLLNGPSTNV